MDQPKKKKKNGLLRFFWGLFPWLIVLGILYFIGNMGLKIIDEKKRLEEEKRAAMKKEIPAVKVITLTMKPERLEDKINLPAEVEPYEDLWVKTEVPGKVVSVLIREGQHVEKGQLLAVIDDRDYNSRIERIEANRDVVEQDYERIMKLVEKKISAEKDLDNINARLKDLNAQLKEAKLALSRTRIQAPISGRINEIKAKEGERIGMDQPVAQILQFDKVKVTVGVPESDVASVFNLKEAKVIIDALDGREVIGEKVFLSRQPQSLARLYDLELVVDNPDRKILPGMFARVELIKEVYNKALSIPLYSVITKGDDHYVYIENEGKVKKRAVELGVLNGWQVHITSGLKPGDSVVVVGHRMLDEGQNVDVVKSISDPSEIITS